MNNSELLAKTLIILKNKKAGKKIIKDFTNFVFKYEELREAFLLTYPEEADNVGSNECSRNQKSTNRPFLLPNKSG